MCTIGDLAPSSDCDYIIVKLIFCLQLLYNAYFKAYKLKRSKELKITS